MIEDVADRGLKPHTATRYLSDVRACFRDAANLYDLKWIIRSNSSGKRNKTQKVITETASEKQMITIAKACIERDDVHGVIGLMWLHGVSPEEIAGVTDPETIKERIPHVVIMDGNTQPSTGYREVRFDESAGFVLYGKPGADLDECKNIKFSESEIECRLGGDLSTFGAKRIIKIDRYAGVLTRSTKAFGAVPVIHTYQCNLVEREQRF